MDWNERFQTAVKKLRKFSARTPLNDRIQGNLNLLHLSKDFLYTAQMYGRIIISEAYLPPEGKTIKPIYTLPGILGILPTIPSVYGLIYLIILVDISL